MSREIKFRVRTASDKKLIGYERVAENGHWEHRRIGRKEYLLGSVTQEDALVREEFTGFVDKNGKEIYEGDIINIPVRWEQEEHDFLISNELLQVIWLNGAWMVDENDLLFDHFDDSIVVGNVHEHPELLSP